MILYDIIWYHTVLYTIIWYNITWYDIIGCHMLSDDIRWYHMTSHQIIWHHLISVVGWSGGQFWMLFITKVTFKWWLSTCRIEIPRMHTEITCVKFEQLMYFHVFTMISFKTARTDLSQRSNRTSIGQPINHWNHYYEPMQIKHSAANRLGYFSQPQTIPTQP